MKLSRKRSVRLSFLASKLALSYDQDERLALLKELLDDLGIDAEQRADSKESADRHLRYEAQRRRQRPAKTASDDPIDSMNHADLRTYIQQLLDKRDRLLAERAKRPDIDAMSDEERAAYQAHLLRSIAGKLEQSPSTPEPAPTAEEAAQYDVTAKQRRRLAAFDDMSDADQLDALQALWGNDEKAVKP